MGNPSCEIVTLERRNGPQIRGQRLSHWALEVAGGRTSFTGLLGGWAMPHMAKTVWSDSRPSSPRSVGSVLLALSSPARSFFFVIAESTQRQASSQPIHRLHILRVAHLPR